MNILGIETSCDETAAAIVVDGRHVLSNVISSQIELHRAHGGIVPELAARGQIQAIIPVVRAAVAESGVAWTAIDAVAFTQGPGLAGSLLVGVNAAKALAMSLGRPLIAVNHLEAHVYANWLTLRGEADREPPRLPAICLLVSGGHTELLLIRRRGEHEVLGRTIDDAAGEAFDKGARLLGLGYPGGPAIEVAAEHGDPSAYALPRAVVPGLDDFSFSGLKTALLRTVEPFRLPDVAPAERPPNEVFPTHRPARYRADLPVRDLAASFEEAIVDALVSKTIRAAGDTGAHTIVIAGGVAANRRLRERMVEGSGDAGLDVRWPVPSLCTDNAAMVAGLGFELYEKGQTVGLDADAYPRWPIGRRAPDGSLATLP
jgi:N6-L-threonylcarbamoyladenine synthase